MGKREVHKERGWCMMEGGEREVYIGREVREVYKQ